MVSTGESCKSRSLTWLVKACLSNPHPSQPQPQPQPPQPSSPTPSDDTSPLISTLPDDLLLECLSRVPASSLPALPLVCSKWARSVSSPDFYSLRLSHLLLRPTVLAIALSDSGVFVASHRFHDAAASTSDHQQPWKTSFFPSDGGQSLLAHARLVAVGPAVYLLARGVTVRYDVWTGTPSARAPMIHPRKKFAAAAVAGRIYVCGGSRGAQVEEYDPASDAWRVVAEAPRKRYGCVGAAVDGVFYAIGGLRIGGGGGGGGGGSVAEYAGSMDAYDVGAGAWLRPRRVPGGGCVVAAAAVDGGVFVVASHAVELSFWRCEGRRGRGGFGEWRRLRAPPVPAQVRVDGRVRFECVGVGAAVALVQVVGSVDDLLRRSGRNGRGLRDGLVLLYDCASGEWGRAPADFPAVLRRAACVCVDC